MIRAVSRVALPLLSLLLPLQTAADRTTQSSWVPCCPSCAFSSEMLVLMAAITLPENRGAGCFGIEALRGHIDFQIMAMDGTVVWHTSMGKEAFDALQLHGGPGTVYHIQAIGGSADSSVTVRFVDVHTGDM